MVKLQLLALGAAVNVHAQSRTNFQVPNVETLSDEIKESALRVTHQES